MGGVGRGRTATGEREDSADVPPSGSSWEPGGDDRDSARTSVRICSVGVGVGAPFETGVGT